MSSAAVYITLPLHDYLPALIKRESEQTLQTSQRVVNDALRRGIVERVTSRSVIEVPVFDLGRHPKMAENPWDVLARDDAASLGA